MSSVVQGRLPASAGAPSAIVSSSAAVRDRGFMASTSSIEKEQVTGVRPSVTAGQDSTGRPARWREIAPAAGPGPSRDRPVDRPAPFACGSRAW